MPNYYSSWSRKSALVIKMSVAAPARYLCDEKYPDVEKIILVQDNLNIRPGGTREHGVCIRRLSRTKHSA